MTPIFNDHEKKQVRESLLLPTVGRLVVYAGPLVRRKDPTLLVRAFMDNASKSDILCLLGDGPLLQECRRLSKTIDNVILPGQVSNVGEYLRDQLLAPFSNLGARQSLSNN